MTAFYLAHQVQPMDVQWPGRWQQEAKDALQSHFYQPAQVDIWLGTTDLKLVMRLIGNIYLDDLIPTIIHDYSGRPGIFPWRINMGPVLRIYELRPRRRALILFADQGWTPPAEEKGAWK